MRRGQEPEHQPFKPASAGEFSGERVNLPADPDSYLRNLYGNYMEIPPEEKREKHYILKAEF